jgi:hypothetical protein
MPRSGFDHGPIQNVEVLCAFDFVSESLASSPVLVAVILSGELDVLPTHVEVIPPSTIGA